MEVSLRPSEFFSGGQGGKARWLRWQIIWVKSQIFQWILAAGEWYSLAGTCIQPWWRKMGEPCYFLAIFRKMRTELFISSCSPGSSRVKSCWSQTKFRKFHFWIKHVSLAQKWAALFLLWISLQDMLTFLRNKPGITRLALGAILWLWGSSSLPCMNSFYVAIGQSYSIQWKMAF